MPPHTLPPLLDTSAAPALHVALSNLIGHGAPIVLDGSAVESAGLACLQLLTTARLSALRQGIEFTLVDPSSALCEMASLACLDSFLDSVA